MSAQDEANKAAKDFACNAASQLALLANPDATELIIDGVPTFPPNLIPPYSSPPGTKLFYNGPQVCRLPCPDGSFFTYTASPGLFSGANQAQADAAAMSYACQQANLLKICPSHPCGIVDSSPLPPFDQGQPYTHQFTASGGTPPFSFTIISGSLPTGLSMNGNGLISGTASLVNGNLDKVFTLRATDSATPPNTCSGVFTLPIVDYCSDSFTKRFRIRGFFNGMFAGCSFGPPDTFLNCQLIAPTPAVPWDGTFPNRFGLFCFPFAPSDNSCYFYQTTGVFNCHGVYKASNAFPTLSPAGPAATCGEWKLSGIECANGALGASGLWAGTKVGSGKKDSPAGIYTRTSGCDGHPTIEIEEYTP